jgi:hypothetical protein
MQSPYLHLTYSNTWFTAHRAIPRPATFSSKRLAVLTGSSNARLPTDWPWDRTADLRFEYSLAYGYSDALQLSLDEVLEALDSTAWPNG